VTADTISARDREIVRELAREVRELSQLPVMAERARHWTVHNEGQPAGRPPVIMELGGFVQEFMAPFPCACESPEAREIEWNLRLTLANHRCVGDDKAVSSDYTVLWQIGFKPFDTDFQFNTAKDANGRALGYAQVGHPVADIARDLPNMPRSSFTVDRAGTQAKVKTAEDLIGDILPVRLKNNSLTWALSLSRYAIILMGDEGLMMAMAEDPDGVRRVYGRIRDDLLAYLDWQEREHLLTLNNGNDYVGAGTYGFSRELPQPGMGEHVRLRDMWCNVNSQETVCISPDMYADLVFPAYVSFAERFGLAYYGCCEPVHDLWERCVSKLPHLRKVSISAWCDEERMGEYLRGGKVIYSRKPSPNYIGIGAFDEKAFRLHILKTLKAAKNCPLEFIFRDIYTLKGDHGRAGRAVAIVRECIAEAR
jgi:hypothetical protein